MFSVCVCVCIRNVHLCANMYAVMCKICMLSASEHQRVCVCASDSGLIKLLHSNELWLSVWQLL